MPNWLITFIAFGGGIILFGLGFNLGRKAAYTAMLEKLNKDLDTDIKAQADALIGRLRGRP